ncbi:MAG: metallophosphoesterase [Candidatus Nanohaloarchaea archaeon]
MRAAIISDIHLLEENREEALEKLEETVERIDEENPDLVIVLGDMIGGAVTTGKEAPEETEGVEELREVRDRVERIEAETLYLLGNHEQDIDKQEFSEVFGQEKHGLKQVGGENFIYLDSSAPELSGSRGQISREQLEFLDEKLEELEDVFLVIHHPVHFRDLSHSVFWDVYPERAFCGNKKEINNVLEKHEGVRAVFNAHIHDLNLTEFKDNAHFTNPPFISESREEGFYEYFTVAEIDESVDLKVFRGEELEKSY